jgi:hypothetical protein
MAKRLTIAEQRARLSPHIAPAVAERDAAARSERATRSWAAKRAPPMPPRLETIAELEARIAALQVELAYRRAAEKAARDKRLAQLHAKAKRYREAHREQELARGRRCRAARIAEAKKSSEAAEAHREKMREYSAAYRAQHKAELAAELCQPSA